MLYLAFFISKSYLQNFKKKKTYTLYINDQSCIKLVDNPIMREKIKYIDIRTHFI